jgi:hypothetical protein
MVQNCPPEDGCLNNNNNNNETKWFDGKDDQHLRVIGTKMYQVSAILMGPKFQAKGTTMEWSFF